jgi:hypothetical protein
MIFIHFYCLNEKGRLNSHPLNVKPQTHNTRNGIAVQSYNNVIIKTNKKAA